MWVSVLKLTNVSFCQPWVSSQHYSLIQEKIGHTSRPWCSKFWTKLIEQLAVHYAWIAHCPTQWNCIRYQNHRDWFGIVKELSMRNLVLVKGNCSQTLIVSVKKGILKSHSCQLPLGCFHLSLKKSQVHWEDFISIRDDNRHSDCLGFEHPL